MPTITGLEFKKFYSEDAFWGGDTYHDDILIKDATGQSWSDSDDLHKIPEDAVLTIESGWVQEINPGLTGGQTDMSLVDFYALWKRKQSTPPQGTVTGNDSREAVSEAMVDAAIAEYRLAMSSDPRNTEQMRDRPGVVQAIQRDAMREALTAALAVTRGE